MNISVLKSEAIKSSSVMKVIKGEMDLNTAFRTAQEEADQAIEEMKMKK